MIDIASETTYPVGEAPPRIRLRRGGKPLHKSTFFRWARHGAIAVDGTRIYLETLRCGGVLFTSDEAVARFFARLSQKPGGQSPASDAVQSADRRRAAEKANSVLELMGS